MHPGIPQPAIIDMLEPNLVAGDILFDLLDIGQMLRQLRQALVRREARLIDRRCTSGDEHRIELIVLGPAQMHTRVGFDLDRLQDENGQALFPQMADHTPFVTATRLDTNTRHPVLDESCGKLPPTCL
jgi:hypothetical protein